MKDILRPMTTRILQWDKKHLTFNEGGRFITFSLWWKNLYGFRIYIMGLALSLVYHPWILWEGDEYY